MQTDLELWEITKETLLSKISGLFIPKSKTTISEVFGGHAEPDSSLGIEGYWMCDVNQEFIIIWRVEIFVGAPAGPVVKYWWKSSDKTKKRHWNKELYCENTYKKEKQHE